MIITVFFNAVSGVILRAGADNNPQLNVAPGEDWLNVNLEGDPFDFFVDTETRQLVPRTDLEKPITWEDIRLSRDYLLTKSDWALLSDAPLTALQVDEARDYRQTLRDLTEVYESPADVLFPDTPEFLK